MAPRSIQVPRSAQKSKSLDALIDWVAREKERRKNAKANSILEVKDKKFQAEVHISKPKTRDCPGTDAMRELFMDGDDDGQGDDDGEDGGAANKGQGDDDGEDGGAAYKGQGDDDGEDGDDDGEDGGAANKGQGDDDGEDGGAAYKGQGDDDGEDGGAAYDHSDVDARSGKKSRKRRRGSKFIDDQAEGDGSGHDGEEDEHIPNAYVVDSVFDQSGKLKKIKRPSIVGEDDPEVFEGGDGGDVLEDNLIRRFSKELHHLQADHNRVKAIMKMTDSGEAIAEFEKLYKTHVLWSEAITVEFKKVPLSSKLERFLKKFFECEE